MDKVLELAEGPGQTEGGEAGRDDGPAPVDLLAGVLSAAVDQAIDGSGPAPSQVDGLLDLRDLLVETPCYSGALAIDSINRALLAVLGRWLIAPASAAQRSAAVERVPRLRAFELEAELFAPWIEGVDETCRDDTGCLVATVLRTGPGPVIEDGARLGMRQLLEHPEPRLLILRMMRTEQDLHIGLPVLRSIVDKDPTVELGDRTIQELLEAREALPPEAGSTLVRRDRYRPVRAMSFVRLLRSEGLRRYALLNTAVEDYVTQYAKAVKLTARPVRPELETWAPMAVRLLLHNPGTGPIGLLVALVPRAVAGAPEDAEAGNVLGSVEISTPGGALRELWLVPTSDATGPRQVPLAPGGKSWAHTVFLFPEDVVGRSSWIEGEYRLAVHLSPFWVETEPGEGRIVSEASLDASDVRLKVNPTPPQVLECLQSGGAEQLMASMRSFLEGRWRLAGEPPFQVARWKGPSCDGTEIARLVRLLEIARACGGESELRGGCALADEDHETVTELARDPEFLFRDEAEELLGESRE